MADTKLSALASATLTEVDTLYIEDGGTSKKATVAELRTALCPKGFVPMPLGLFRIIGDDTADEIGDLAANAGLLANDATPLLERVSTSTDKALRIAWAASDVTEMQADPVMMPPDLAETVDVTIHLLAQMSGATDTPTINAEVFDAVGDTEMGGVTAALSASIQELTVTIANADISGNPLGFFNVSLIPGAHGTDILWLYGAWMEYTRKLPV
jgi:hypothetical protein